MRLDEATMKRLPNKSDAPNPAIAPPFHAGRLWRGVGDPYVPLAADAMKAARFSFLASAVLSLAGCCSVKLTSVPEQPGGRVMKVGGHDLFLRQTGVGPDVVMLRGLGESSIGWQFIELGLIQAGYRVTVWDSLGAGRSEKPASGDYSIQGHVKRLEEMLDALGIREAVFIGHSLGGSEALLCV